MSKWQRIELMVVTLGFANAWALADCPSAAPTPVVSAPSIINAWTLKNGEIFWAEGRTGEFCTFTAIRKEQVGGGLASVSLYAESAQNCSHNFVHVRTDGAHVYLADDTFPNDQIYRIWVAPAGSPGAGVLGDPLVTATGQIRDLEIDDATIWWVDDLGIRRKPKTGGSTTTYLASSDIRQIAMGTLPLRKIYWTTQLGGGGQLVSAAAKSSSASPVIVGLESDVVTALEVNSENPAADTFVYWGTAGGDLRRSSHTAGNQTTYDTTGPTTPLPTFIRAIVVDNTHIYWTESAGATEILKRIPTSGAGSTTEMWDGLPLGTSPLHLDSDHVYYRFNSISILRICKDTTAPLTDLAWWGMEVTQGIQDMANSVSLVRDKPTTVRAYPKSTTGRTLFVFAELWGFRGVFELPGSPLPHSSLAIPAGEDFKRDSLTVYSWELPASWVNSETSVTLSVRLDPANSIPETDESTSSNWTTLPEAVTFAARAPVCGVFFTLRIIGDEPYWGSSEPSFINIIDRFESVWPISELLTFPGGPVFDKRGGRSVLFDCDASCGSAILDAVGRQAKPSNIPDECADLNGQTHWIGMTRRTAGSSQNPNLSFVAMRGDAPTADFRPRGGHIIAQELGHNRGMGHVRCGKAYAANAFPYCSDICTDGSPPGRWPCCALDCDNGPNAHWGYDHLRGLTIEPFGHGDFMGASRHWVADWTWEFLFNAIGPPLPARSATSSEERLSARAAASGYNPADTSDEAKSAGSVCGPGAGSCCDAAGNGTPGCDDPACCEVVCACDPVCCDGGWDQFCAQTGFDGNRCGAQLLCDSCFQQSNDLLWLTGTVSETSNEGVITFAARVPNDLLNGDPSQPATIEASTSAINLTTVTVEMIGSSGQLLASYIADVPQSSDHEINVLRHFEVVAPFANGTAKLRVLKDGNPLIERLVSPNPPTVSILAPQLGDTPVTDLSVMFVGADPENSELHYIVQYSPNHGSRWITLEPIPKPFVELCV